MKLFKFTQTGRSHITLGTDCQDACKHYISDDGSFAAGALADGVGSCKNAKEAAEAATEGCIKFVSAYYGMCRTDEDYISLIRLSMAYACNAVCKECVRNDGDIYQYDTTLMVVVAAGGRFYYGHSGDGGIVAKLSDGTYKNLTTPHEDENGFVITLMSGSKTWDVGVFEEDISTIMLATDGIYDQMCPTLLKSTDNGVYSNMCALFSGSELDSDTAVQLLSGDGGKAINERMQAMISRDVADSAKAAELTDAVKTNKILENAVNSITDDIGMLIISKGETKSPAGVYDESEYNAKLTEVVQRLFGDKSKADNDSGKNNPEPKDSKATGTNYYEKLRSVCEKFKEKFMRIN